MDNLFNIKKCPRCDSEMNLYLNNQRYNYDGDELEPTVKLMCSDNECLLLYGDEEFKINFSSDLHEKITKLIED